MSSEVTQLSHTEVSNFDVKCPGDLASTWVRALKTHRAQQGPLLRPFVENQDCGTTTTAIAHEQIDLQI